jgi:hypothetical protein
VWKLVVFILAIASLGFQADTASARAILLKGTHTQGQVEIACTKADGASTEGRGHGGFGCNYKTSKGEVECDAGGECIGTCQRCGTRKTRSLMSILHPSYGRKAPGTRSPLRDLPGSVEDRRPLAFAPWAKMRIALPAAPQPRSLRLGTVDEPAEPHLPILGFLLQIFPTSGYETIA